MKVAFFPGCVIPIKYPGVEAATRALADKLDLELVDLPFHCCPSPTGIKEASKEAWLALAADNLCLAQEQELDLMTICSGCGNTFRETIVSCQKDTEKCARVNELLAPQGKEYRQATDVMHLPELLAQDEWLERLAAACERPLNGLKVGTHYGCHYFRPSAVMADETWSQEFPLPESMELILETLGAEIVDYPRQELCCGASLSYNVGRGDASLEIMSEKLQEMSGAEVEAIAVPCPSCLTQFDTGQSLLRRKDKALEPIPVYHIAELIAYALGADVAKLDGKRHRVKAPLLCGTDA